MTVKMGILKRLYLYHFSSQIVTMVFNAIKRLSIEHSQPFFKLMSMLVEFGGGPPGLPPFTQYVLQRFWDVSMNILKYNN